MFDKIRRRDSAKSISANPSFFSKEQFGSYLSNLRTYRPSQANTPRPQSVVESDVPDIQEASVYTKTPQRCSSAMSQRSVRSILSMRSSLSRRNQSYTDQPDKARTDPNLTVIPAVFDPHDGVIARDHTTPLRDGTPIVLPGAQYIERGTRWMERQESRSLRMAMEDMDQRTEKAIFSAAGDEASELIWHHQNPDKPFPPTEVIKPNYREHLRKGSHARSHSISYSSSMASSLGSRSQPSSRSVSASSQLSQSTTASGTVARIAVEPSHRQVSSHRRRSSGSRRALSGQSAKSVFRNPEDKIYEEPEILPPVPEQRISQLPTVQIGASKLRSNQPSVQALRSRFDKSANERARLPIKALPSRSRNAEYTTNTAALRETSGRENVMAVETRSDDIREATSKRRADRSENLPQPTLVSNKLERPIVSFEQGKLAGSFHAERPGVEIPAIEVSPVVNMVAVPIINLPDERPMPAVPSINISSNDGSQDRRSNTNDRRHNHRQRPLPKPGARFTPSWNARRTGATCMQCDLPIAGKILTAAGDRFHPECFICYHCGEGLELVAFYPEPEHKRDARLQRINARCLGQRLPEGDGEFAADDGDSRPRFYCHLDFHELFSPRCRSCKTPIEGEVIVACGGEWHVGHFFCAECGDPFNQSTPFVEKEGYAWCLRCHKNRYSTKCKKCRRPVTELVINALGAEWHEHCFTCTECGSAFDQGRFFVRGESQDPVCVRCEELRLKA